jgi:hypothetical protein
LMFAVFMLFQRTLMLFTAQELQNFFTMHLEPHVLHAQNVFLVGIKTMEL